MQTPHDATLKLFEALLHQGEAIRELKLEVESLKNMFFEHRPAFVAAFAEHRAKLAKVQKVVLLDEQLAKLRAAIESQRGGEG